MEYFIYALRCPIDNEIKYIGCSKNPEIRLKFSFNGTFIENRKKQSWFKFLKDSQMYPIIEILDKTECFNTAVQLEQKYIDSFRSSIFNAKHRVYYRG